MAAAGAERVAGGGALATAGRACLGVTNPDEAFCPPRAQLLLAQSGGGNAAARPAAILAWLLQRGHGWVDRLALAAVARDAL